MNTALQFGAEGSVAITGTLAVTPPAGYKFYIVDFTEDSVVAAQTATTGATVADLTTIPTIPAKTVMTSLTSITLTSGAGIGYIEKI